MIIRDLTGIKFGALEAVKISPSNVYREKRKWVCKCECGKVLEVSRSNLITGNTRSCGCVGQMRLLERLTTHGASGSRLHNIWSNIRARCNNPGHPAYEYYGGRGIKVCDEWRDFSSFKEWAEMSGYSSDLTIDRIDVNRGYKPKNCRWATRKQQSINRRVVRPILRDDGTIYRTIAQAAIENGISKEGIRRSLKRGTPVKGIGWTYEGEK